MPMDLSLPDLPTKRRPPFLPAVTLLAILVAIGLLVFRGPAASSSAVSDQAANPLDSAKLAATLEKRTLYEQAAEVWERIAPRQKDRAKALFRAGRSRMLAGDPAPAIRDFIAAESAGLTGDLKRRAGRYELTCYATLGKFAVRNEELVRQTGGKTKDDAVVARVGDEPVTRGDLATLVRAREAQRLQMEGKLTAKSLDRAVVARMADPKSLAPLLERLLTERALALSALADGIGKKPEFARRVAQLRREVLGNMLIRQRLTKAGTVTKTELMDHYKAHPELSTVPAAVRFSYGPAGTPPAKLHKVKAWHEKGDAYPGGLGTSAEADALLFAMKPGQVAERTVPFGKKKILFRLDDKRKKKHLSFAAAEQKVRADLLQQKRSEALVTLEHEVRKDHPVKILDAELKKAVQAEGGMGK